MYKRQLNKVLFYKEDGVTPGLIQIAPFFYMFGIGGWNAVSAGNVFINFPGFEQKDYSVAVSYTHLDVYKRQVV